MRHDRCKCDTPEAHAQKKPPTVETEAGLRKSTLRIAVKNALIKEPEITVYRLRQYEWNATKI